MECIEIECIAQRDEVYGALNFIKQRAVKRLMYARVEVQNGALWGRTDELELFSLFRYILSQL